ncbi:MAG TPA: hypothetical protein VGP94_03935 [Tepidisphaeraceae bacterium]|nr:hypothetical protein [Tepidisphaeraceae bacterium]
MRIFLEKLLAAAFVLLGTTMALADPRPFTFTYDAYPIGKGGVEYEQWITFNTDKGTDHDFRQFQFLHELEYGISDNFDLGLYFLRWNYQDSREESGTQYDGGAVELIYTILNPGKDKWGLALYGEIGVAENELEFEQKVLVQKDIGKWILAYNLILETEIAGVFDSNKANEVEGVIGHAFGVTTAVARTWFVGGELLVESVFPDWSHYETTTAYLGPTISYQGGDHWWATVTPAYQITGEDEEANWKIRLIAGWEF